MDYFDSLSKPEQKICYLANLKKLPVNAVLELTPLCNMNCDMCYVRLNRQEMQRYRFIPTSEDWLRLAGELRKAGVLFVLLTGGEPLLHPGFKQLYLTLREMGMILTVNTNGTLLDEEWADFFAAHSPRRINITLYGTSSKQYADLCHYPQGFDQALNAIRLLNERGVAVKINGSITPANETDGANLLELAASMHTECKIDTYMHPENRERGKPFNQQARLTPERAARARISLLKKKYSDEAFLRMAQQMTADLPVVPDGKEDTHMQCRAGSSSFAVNWQGYMRPCVLFPAEPIPIFELGFSAAWEKVKQLADGIRLNPKCCSCRYRNACQTCAACAYSETGSFDGIPDYMCRYAAESYRLLKQEAALYSQNSGSAPIENRSEVQP